MLQIGCAQVDITPEPGLSMAGMPAKGPATGVVWPLQGHVFVADDGTARVALVSLDLMALTAGAVAEIRARFATQHGLAPATVMITCSHTHRAPYTFTNGDVDEGIVYGYVDLVADRLAQAMTDALEALTPAQLVVGHTAVPGWSFNRRPIYEDGQVGTQGPAWTESFVRMEGPADDELQVLVARRQDGHVLGGLVSFACHPTLMAFEPVYSADYVGALVEELAARHGGSFGFVLGAAGNVIAADPASQDTGKGHGRPLALEMARALADAADAAIASGRVVAAEHVAGAQTIVHVPQRRPTSEQVALARWYLEAAPDDLDEHAFRQQLYGHPHDFYNNNAARANERFVRELLGMWEWQQRVDSRELIEAVEVQLLTIGDVAVVGYPVELFSELGLQLKAQSPIADTWVATLANGWYGYVPTQEAFRRGGYEPRLAYSSRLIPEAGERMTAAALELLDSAVR